MGASDAEPAGLPARFTAMRSLDVVATLLLLFALALGQPLLDVLGRNAEFFVAREARVGEILALAAILTLGIPLLLTALALAVGALHPRAGAVLHAVLLVVLGAAWSLQLLERIAAGRSVSGALLLAAATLVGVVVCGALFASLQLRSVARVGLVVPLLVAGLFLLASPVSRIVIPASAEVAQEGIADPVPIVMVVFDEFPVASLLDRSGDIDAKAYPNFARLAREATWFRNATTVDISTDHAVPAILDGRYSRGDNLPVLRDHPRNLFTLLGDQYAIHSWEPITQLCPAKLCPDQSDAGSLGWWRSTAYDLSVISGHVLLPPDLTRQLPAIDQGWSGFAGRQPAGTDPRCAGQLARCGSLNAPVAWADRRQPESEAFLDSLDDPSSRPTLHFLHTLFPHQPWQYLPSGQQYTSSIQTPGLFRGEWEADDWLVTQGYQRHLLQVGAADRFIGRLRRRLQSARLYNEALVVITADHGASFRSGQPFRSLRSDNFGSLGAVPLFIKPPGAARGGVDDRPVESVDLLPTIAEVLDEPALARDSPGASLLSGPGPRRDHKRVRALGVGFRFPADGAALRSVVARKFALFGSDNGSVDPYHVAPEGTAGLLGRRVGRVGDAQGVTVRLDDPQRYASVDPTAAVVPNLVTGRLAGDVGATGPARVA
ncbi:MAG: sulfatase-like hydrolase/transferase, partial [Actinomycetota bacterium]|nr:sulfatase-like hydrolase/transferase [Actinomycetota bacterium]